MKNSTPLSNEAPSEDRRQVFDANRLLPLVLDNNPFAIFWKDADLVYRGCNARFAQMAGFDSPAAVPGKTDFDMPWGFNNDVGAEACRASDARVIQSGREEMHIIELIQQENGEVVWTDTSKVPIRDESGAVVGVLCTLEDITARKLAEQALEEANRKLDELSRIDSLTQIANRRHFDERLAEAWARALREGDTLSIILFDIDYFKKLNDNHGHLAGDYCLTEVASAAASVLNRATDCIARFGGEEFIVLLTNVDSAGTTFIAEKLRQTIQALRIHFEGQEISLTISLGLAVEAAVFNTRPTALIAKADAALYQAKHQGRNCVVTAEG